MPGWSDVFMEPEMPQLDGTHSWLQSLSRWDSGKESPALAARLIWKRRGVVLRYDFVFVGSEANLQRVETQMTQSFLVKVIGRLGGTTGDLKEMRVLNRMFRWTQTSILMEDDPDIKKFLTFWLHWTQSLSRQGVKEKCSNEWKEDGIPGDECVLGEEEIY